MGGCADMVVSDIGGDVGNQILLQIRGCIMVIDIGPKNRAC
jgi:uncharacterized Rossmann fold enzyme